MTKKFPGYAVLLLIGLLALSAVQMRAQTTEFTYQGRLTDNSMPPTASYDFAFYLFGVETGGGPLGIVQRLGVPVASGVFSVRLDFGTQFDGTARYLEISVKPAGGASYTTLTPRQPITSAPYNIKSLSAVSADTAVNSNQLGGVTANQFVQTGDSRMSDARNPLPGSTNYIQNTNAAQIFANFNIGGTGTANVLGAGTQFDLGGTRILSRPGTANLFIGVNSGAVNTTGDNNTFVGLNTGKSNTTGDRNAFFGAIAGVNNTEGIYNAFFGSGSGFGNTTGSDNSFFGANTGVNNTTGITNSFFGTSAGNENTTGSGNAFFGAFAGSKSTTASDNSFFGDASGAKNTTGTQNAFFGTFAGNANTTASNNSFFGAVAGTENTTGTANAFFGASAGTANTLGNNNSFFGANSGSASTTGSGNAFFGTWAGNNNTVANFNSFFGAFAGNKNTTGISNVAFGNSSGISNTSGSKNVFLGTSAGKTNTNGDDNTLLGYNADVGGGNLSFATAIGADSIVSSSNTIALGRAAGDDTVVIYGKLQVDTLGTSGATQLCINNSNRLATCSSSLRYKTGVQEFSGGLDMVRRLRPIAFAWKDNPNLLDVGFGAEEVARVEPRLVTYRDGVIEGVKYAQITTVLVNAVNEQQAQIEEFKQLLEKQQAEIALLRKLVCAQSPNTEICGGQR